MHASCTTVAVYLSGKMFNAFSKNKNWACLNFFFGHLVVPYICNANTQSLSYLRQKIHEQFF